MRRWSIIFLAVLIPAISGLFFVVSAAPKSTAGGAVRRPPVAADPPAAKPESGELRTYRALQRRITIQMQNESLTVVVKEIAARSGINCLIDPRALQEAGVSPDVKIRVDANDVRLSTLLDQIVTPLGLDFVVINETVNITNRSRAKGNLLSVTYPISDLTMRFQNGRNAPDQEAVDHLIEAITTTVAPESWTEQGGPGSITFSEKNVNLVVRQTADAQREIQSLLARLRRERTSPTAGRARPPARPLGQPKAAQPVAETPAETP
jgi:type II secretory pathway component GspD/PulD (secretin)